ncbi:MAG: right-handed parallel beta-helix repeat-containing protein [Rhodospirillales bacterium]|nr:right-handed parallel beta-helix repeat-containing protein [Rhodospirillales bacterium]
MPRRYRLAEDAPETLPGLGGQARFKAYNRETGKAVFIKVAEDGSIIPKEAEVLTRLDHPAIVRLKQWGRGGGAAFLILDLVDAPDLEMVLRRRHGRLGVKEIKALLAALCSGVEAIHAAGCLHRDLKPANILVPDFSAPVIADFGAAVSLERAGGEIETWLTDGYAAPEQYRADENEGPWTDLYALAAIAYRALVGSPPPPASARLNGAWISPAVSVVGGDAMELAAAVDRALNLDPAKRPQSAEAWAAMLKLPRPEPLPILTPAEPTAAGDSAGDVGAESREAGAAEADVDDDVAPTVRIRRTAGERSEADAAAVAAEESVPPARRRMRWWPAAVLAFLALVGIAAVWAGRPFYERYFKSEWVVAQDGSGDLTTIGEALRRAGDEAIIRVKDGTYAETVVLNHPVHLAAADGAEPVIAPADGPCLIARGEGGTITGLTLKGASDGEGPLFALPCVLISSGSVWLQDVRVSSPEGPAIVVRDGAMPMIQRATVTDTPAPAVLVRSGAEPTIRDSTFTGSGSLVFSEGAKGTLENNTITASRGSGLQIRSGADPRVVGNTLEGSGEAGVFVYDSGRGRLENNRIVGSALSGVIVADGGTPKLMGNTVTKNGEHGILILGGSGGAIDRNTVTENKGNGLVLAPDSVVELGTNQLEDNNPPQLVDARAR